jgi:hypothetical protein
MVTKAITASTEPRMRGRSWIRPKFTRSVGAVGGWVKKFWSTAHRRRSRRATAAAVSTPGRKATAIT